MRFTSFQRSLLDFNTFSLFLCSKLLFREFDLKDTIVVGSVNVGRLKPFYMEASGIRAVASFLPYILLILFLIGGILLMRSGNSQHIILQINVNDHLDRLRRY